MTCHVHPCPTCYERPPVCIGQCEIVDDCDGIDWGDPRQCSACAAAPKCIDCKEEIATVGDRCRDCDIAHLVDAMMCAECGRQIMGGNSVVLGMKPYDHAETCSRFCKWCGSKGCLICAQRIEAAAISRIGDVDLSEHEEVTP